MEDGGGQGGFRGLPQNMRKMYRQGQAGAEGRREQRTPGHGESAAGTDWSDLGNAEGERKKQGRNRTNEGEVRRGERQGGDRKRGGAKVGKAEGDRRGGGERREEDTTKEDVSDGGRRKERRTISIFFQGLEV